MVYLSPIKNFQSVWSLNYADMDYRVEMESMPVEVRYMSRSLGGAPI